jgi:hypothetical protein
MFKALGLIQHQKLKSTYACNIQDRAGRQSEAGQIDKVTRKLK